MGAVMRRYAPSGETLDRSNIIFLSSMHSDFARKTLLQDISIMPEMHLSPSEAQDELRTSYYAGDI
jgi:hypothetical protein